MNTKSLFFKLHNSEPDLNSKVTNQLLLNILKSVYNNNNYYYGNPFPSLLP